MTRNNIFVPNFTPMRLFQLARKLGTTPDNLLTVLAEHNYEVENQSNAKLADEHVELLTNYFNPSQEVQEETEKPVVKEDIQEVQVMEPEPNDTDSEVEATPESESQNVEETSEKVDEVEVIRVKKVKLDGPKVVGKIDLPEPVVKPVPEKKEREEKRGKHRRADKRKSSLRRLTPEQLRLKEQREKEQQRKREERKRKKNRAKYYQEYVQPKPDQPKKPKKKKAVIKTVHRNSPKRKEKHKNPIKRLWAWLNGEYDRF